MSTDRDFVLKVTFIYSLVKHLLFVMGYGLFVICYLLLFAIIYG